MTDVKPITNEAERQAALDRLRQLRGATRHTPEGRESRELAKAIEDYEKTYCLAWNTTTDGVDEIEYMLGCGDADIPGLLEIFGGRQPFLDFMLRRQPLDDATIDAILARYNTKREWLDKPFCEPPGWESLTGAEWIRAGLDAVEGEVEESAPGPEVVPEAERDLVIAAGS